MCVIPTRVLWDRLDLLQWTSLLWSVFCSARLWGFCWFVSVANYFWTSCLLSIDLKFTSFKRLSITRQRAEREREQKNRENTHVPLLFNQMIYHPFFCCKSLQPAGQINKQISIPRGMHRKRLFEAEGWGVFTFPLFQAPQPSKRVCRPLLCKSPPVPVPHFRGWVSLFGIGWREGSTQLGW